MPVVGRGRVSMAGEPDRDVAGDRVVMTVCAGVNAACAWSRPQCRDRGPLLIAAAIVIHDCCPSIPESFAVRL